MAERPDDSLSGLGDEIADAVRRQVDEVTETLRAEVERLQAEAVERARDAGRGAALIGAAAGTGIVAAAALASLPLIALRKVVPPTLLALGIAAGGGAAAFVLARHGVDELKRAAPDAVAERIDEVEADLADSLKRRAGVE
jgi:hypothetical protein